MTIEESKQSLTPGRRVELFDFDATALGGTLFNFISSYAETQPLYWQGRAYTPIPIEANGFEVNARGTLPQPTLRISNVLLLPGTVINDIGDPIGAKITRWVTFSDYLDDGPNPGAGDHFLPQVFYVEQKTAQNRVYVDFRLASAMDHEGRQLPKRQVIRDTCPLIYRTFNPDTGDFDYTKATCPYAGSAYYKPDGTPTGDPAQDGCGKILGQCRKRFSPAPLPYGGFPAVARIR